MFGPIFSFFRVLWARCLFPQFDETPSSPRGPVRRFHFGGVFLPPLGSSPRPSYLLCLRFETLSAHSGGHRLLLLVVVGSLLAGAVVAPTQPWYPRIDPTEGSRPGVPPFLRPPFRFPRPRLVCFGPPQRLRNRYLPLFSGGQIPSATLPPAPPP